MPFVGLEPIGLVGLADTCDQYTLRLRLASEHVTAALDRYPALAVRTPDTELLAVLRSLEDQAVQLRWRADVIERAQYSVAVNRVYWLAEFAAQAPFDNDTRGARFISWSQERFLRQLAGKSPSVAAATFITAEPWLLEGLADRFPETIGSLDGAPAELRYRANSLLIAAEIERLETVVAGASSAWSPVVDVVLDRLRARITEYRRWLAEGRQILLFDPSGDGRVAEVFGDLATAKSIAVVVPGMANDIDNFSDGETGFRLNAAALQSTSGGGSASVAWLGYDTPDGVDAAVKSAAESGAGRLIDLLEGLDPHGTARVTVVAHSYGSVVAGLAATDGLQADNLVLVGSPGTTLADAAEANLRRDGQVWAALASRDPIGVGVDPSSGFEWWHLFTPFGPGFTIANSLLEREELWHGANPVTEEFGAIRFSTNGSSGHSEYFKGESLENLARIVTGDYDSVVLQP